MKEKKLLKWGIAGLGAIAHKFVNDLKLVEGVKLEAVASRNTDKAIEFAKTYNAEKSYGSYDALFRDDEVDIIYIATPHNSHAELSIKAMNNGKHILCEKPMAVNEHQVSQMISAAKNNGVFLMEAFWSRFFPTTIDVLDKIQKGVIGKVNYINADFCFYGMDSPKSRVLDLELAGGSLLDIGVYPLFLAYAVFGQPEEILATSIFHKSGADIQTAAILRFDTGLANITCGFNSDSDMIARVYGEKGSILIDAQWHHAQGYKMVVDGEETHFDLPSRGRGFTYEIEECRDSISRGQSESERWSLSDSLALIKICDRIRNITGLKYPFENK